MFAAPGSDGEAGGGDDHEQDGEEPARNHGLTLARSGPPRDCQMCQSHLSPRSAPATSGTYVTLFGMRFAGAPLPRIDGSVVAVEPPGRGPGFWAGAPSAVVVDDRYYLAYRLRRPVGQGRGYAVVLARSGNGVEFEPLTVLAKEEFGRASCRERV